MKKVLLLFAAMCCMMGVAKAENPNATKIGNVYYILDEANLTATVTWGGQEYRATAEYTGSITIPATVTNEDETYNVTGIGYMAFYYCDLTSITLPNSLESIGEYAFESCDELTSITLPNSLESIGEEAFRSCDKLASITIPGTVTSIGDGAFEYCESLTSITIPSSVTEIGKYLFNDCILLSSVKVEEGNTVYDSRGNCNAIIETATNTLINGCKNTVIPSSVTAIGDYAFYGCKGLTSITIPSGVTSIGYKAFDDCNGLESVTLQNGITSIEYGAFMSCESLTSITIPGSVTSISTYAFSYCHKLESVTLQNGITSIGEYAFYSCDNLTSITIPSSVTIIDHGAFLDCEGLESVTIPTSVKSISEYAFGRCTALESITVLASTPPTLGENAFNSVTKTIPVYVPNVTAYSNVSWGGFTNFQAIDLAQIKQNAIDEINAAKAGVSLTKDDKTAINACITTIEGVTTLSDENLTIIENAKNEAFAVISQAIIRKAREAAIADIEAAMQGETSDYLTGLVQEDIATINSATDVTAINNVKNTAVTALNAVVAAYKAGKGEAIGSLGEKQNGPAVKVIDQDDNSVILYNPKKVNFIKVSTKE